MGIGGIPGNKVGLLFDCCIAILTLCICDDKKWKCKLCKKLLPLAAQVDHVIPLALGGLDDMRNMQMLCANCHAEKSRKEAKQSVEKGRGIKTYFASSLKSE